MKLQLNWGENGGESYTTRDFGIEPKDAVAIAGEVENFFFGDENQATIDPYPLTVKLIGGTQAVRWFFEQLNTKKRLHDIDEKEKLNSIIFWATDVYREGITEAAVLIHYMTILDSSAKTYDKLKKFRARAEDGQAAYFQAFENSALMPGIVEAKMFRYSHLMMPPDPNEKARTEPVQGAIMQYNDGYVITERRADT